MAVTSKLKCPNYFAGQARVGVYDIGMTYIHAYVFRNLNSSSQVQMFNRLKIYFIQIRIKPFSDIEDRNHTKIISQNCLYEWEDCRFQMW